MTTETAPPGVIRVRADNPSPLTLDGTNTYVFEGWVVDPGPAEDRHLQAVFEAASQAGGIDGIVLTHGHSDHAEGAPALASMAGGVEVITPSDGNEVGPLRALGTPGHSPDHVCLLGPGGVCFSGDTVLGSGSVFVAPGEGSLAAYLDSLRRLRDLELTVICPGHGPFVSDPRAKVDEYIEHRLDREERLVEALEAGARSHDEMLDAAWSEVAADLRPAARITLEAHLEKLREEGRLPPNL